MRRGPRRRLVIAGSLAMLSAGVAGTDGEPHTPWPAGPPSDLSVNEGVADALDLLELERFEEFREAAFTGEDSGHSTVRQEEIDAGQYTVDDLFALGDAVFGHEFRGLDGYATSETPVAFQRVHGGVRGGLDNFSCAGCHSVGGPDGAGSATQNALLAGDGEHLSSALVRNPPALLGLGMVQEIGAEISFELQKVRTEATEAASASGAPVEAVLSARGISYGTLTATPGGAVEYDLDGIDEDLVVKPFGWKGEFSTLRRAIEDAARIHFGIQSGPMAEQHRDTPRPELLGSGENWWDPDGDGVQREFEEGSITATAVYLATLEVPIILPPATPSLRDRWARGDALFDAVGCASCHVRAIGIAQTVWQEHPDTTGAPPFAVPLFHAGEGPKGTGSVKLFSDLKRHDMGPDLADPHADTVGGIDPQLWLTRPLWGLAESPPYLHDGRAATIPDAILAHGGEAEESRNAFDALAPDEQANLHIFLLSLTRSPKVRVPL